MATVSEGVGCGCHLSQSGGGASALSPHLEAGLELRSSRLSLPSSRDHRRELFPPCAHSDGDPASPGDLWLEGRPPLGQVAEDGHLALGPGPQPGPQSPHGHRHRRAAVANPAHGCCLVGCTQSDLLGLCPH
jgi:hypothetical protein